MDDRNESERLNKINLNADLTSHTPERNKYVKRDSYLDWEDYFMSVAILSAMRSKDPCTQVGACIVNNEKKIVGIGYNGMPRGCSDDEFSWDKNTENALDSKYLYVCHAEINAILNKNSSEVKDCTLYTSVFPCNECVKVIIQTGIKTVVYMLDKFNQKVETIAAKRMLDAAKIAYRQHVPKQDAIIINFKNIDWINQNQLPTPKEEN